MNKCFVASVVVLVLFLLFAILVSPKVNFNARSNSPIIKADSSALLNINNSHSQALNQLMIALTKYGREVFWPIAIILLFVLGGWTGKKTAVVIAMSKSDFLIAADSEYAYPSGHAMIVSAGAAVAK